MNTERLISELNRRMAELDMGQKTLALSAGLNETYVRDILKGKSKRPDVFSIGRLAMVLHCSIEDLIGIPSNDFQRGKTVDGPEFMGKIAYSQEEIAIIQLWNSLLPDQKDHFIGLMEAVANRKIT